MFLPDDHSIAWRVVAVEGRDAKVIRSSRLGLQKLGETTLFEAADPSLGVDLPEAILAGSLLASNGSSLVAATAPGSTPFFALRTARSLAC
ncbi:MAG: hypothetical protein U0165_06910 [Polyangiaceae bacterium]